MTSKKHLDCTDRLVEASKSNVLMLLMYKEIIF